MAVLARNYVHQGTLETVVRELFPDEYIIKNARKESGLVNPVTGNFLELDVWLPNLNLCFEFQDPHHYASTTWDSFRNVEEIRKRDEMKKEMARASGEDLILIPCWWDGEHDSLAATTRFQRPDLLPTETGRKVEVNGMEGIEEREEEGKKEGGKKEEGKKEEGKKEEGKEAEEEDDGKDEWLPVSLNPPMNLFSDESIPVIGEMMLASFPLATHSFSNLFEESFWWLGEKYDGVRFCWIPAAKAAYSRSGSIIRLPSGFSSIFGKSLLDGEMWFGRRDFQSSQLLVRSAENVYWCQLRSIVFDVPTPFGRKSIPFEKRYSTLLFSVPPSHPFLISATRMKCENQKFVTFASQLIIDDGGEGIILRKPKSIYQYGRSNLVLKIKASRGDLEGLVVDIDGHDIYLQLPDGETMKVKDETGMSIFRGDIVTFSYESYSRRALPTEARILRVREDTTWEKIVSDYFQQLPKSQILSDESIRALGGVPKPFGYWNVDRHRKATDLFMKFAKSKNFNPLVPENWYAVPKLELYEFQDMRSMLQAYGCSHVKVLQMLFPDIGLDESKFSHVTTNYWQLEGNRRNFFTKVAAESGFDPLIAKNWYSFSRADLLARKGARAVLSYYTNLHDALVHLFPEMNFAKNKFRTKKPANFWQNTSNIRQVLEKYAKRNGFDPLVPENWYTIDLRQDKKLRFAIIRYSDGSLRKALKSVFPHVKWNDFAFRRVSKLYWEDTNKQRTYFENYARQRGLDPLVPSTWYSVFSRISSKEARTITSYYKKNIVTALTNLFPDIGLDRTKFGNGMQLLWQPPRKGNFS